MACRYAAPSPLLLVPDVGPQSGRPEPSAAVRSSPRSTGTRTVRGRRRSTPSDASRPGGPTWRPSGHGRQRAGPRSSGRRPDRRPGPVRTGPSPRKRPVPTAHRSGSGPRAPLAPAHATPAEGGSDPREPPLAATAVQPSAGCPSVRPLAASAAGDAQAETPPQSAAQRAHHSHPARIGTAARHEPDPAAGPWRSTSRHRSFLRASCTASSSRSRTRSAVLAYPSSAAVGAPDACSAATA